MNQDGSFLSAYKEQMIETMKKMNPDWKRKDIEKELSKMIDDNFQSPTVILDNNYTGESRQSTLISVLDWAIDNKPILSGNLTFYKRQDQAINPISEMLRMKLAERKALKKKMYTYVDIDKYMYATIDRSQGNVKRLVNSYYGGAGMPTSPFYSKWSGPAVTGGAQQVISTCEQCFEGFVADNYNFIDITECIEWLNLVLSDFDYLDDFIQIQSIPTVLDRLYDKILNHSDDDIEILDNYLSNISDEEVTFIYYKNNMIEFIDTHHIIQEIIYDIFNNVENLDYVDVRDSKWYEKISSDYPAEKFKFPKDYNDFVNKIRFMDPNNPPENINKYLTELDTYMMKYVYVNYLSFDRIYRLRNFKRKCVTIIDTDSNILSLDTIVNYIFDTIVKGESFGREFIYNEFIVVNMLTYLITSAVRTILYTYSCKANITEDYRTLLAMKSEFFFKRLVIGKTKKRYISRITLREGSYINPPKYDVKGLTLKLRPRNKKLLRIMVLIAGNSR